MASGADLIQEFYDEILCAGNLDKIDDLVTDDVVDHAEGPPGQPEGKEGVRFFVSIMRDAFSDLKVTMGPSVESEDMASAEVTISGKHTGDFMGVPATDKSFEIKCVDIIRYEGEKCAEHWGVIDMMSLMQQLGAIPEPAASA